MGWDPITKAGRPGLPPNLDDYEKVYERFGWDEARAAMDGLPGGRGLNIAHEAVDRHAGGPLAGRVALRCLDRHDRITELTYAGLREETCRFANVLRGLGVRKGDRVFSLLGRVPELYVTALGTLKNTSVLSPLFPAFGPEPIRDRLRLGDGKVLVTSPELYTRKIAQIRDELPGLRHVLVVGGAAAPPGTVSYREAMDGADPVFEIPPTGPEDMALLHFTSGTTGTPKGAVHVHEAVVAHHATAAYALDLRRGDVFWCTADPGWVTGTSYGIIAPLTHGATLLVDAAEWSRGRWSRRS
ncbi:AMP-binding protein [Actinomadura coerulea]|uniref:AMP-binding protein n=1 Tax=Actinomadura coerulea TaxID=46159 RepID=UPI003422AE42